MNNSNILHSPPVIKSALQRLNDRLPYLITTGVYRKAGRVRAARSDFLKNLKAVLVFLIRHYDIVSGNVLIRVSRDHFATVTPAIVAAHTGLCDRTIKRIFRYLIDLNLLKPETQRRPIKIPNPNGYYLLFTSITRNLTETLFEILGVLPQLKKDRAGRLNHELTIRRTVCRKFFGQRVDDPPVCHSPARLTTSPGQTSRPHQNGPTSLADLFRKMAGMGIPVPDHLLK